MLTAQAPQAAALADAARAVEAARDAFRDEAKPSVEQVVKLRFALEKAVRTRSGQLGRFHPGTLEAAGLWGVALQRTGDVERGDRVWVRACTELQRGIKVQERFHGADSKALLPHLEALEACFEAQGLNPWPFRERLLSIAIATSTKPAPDLERRALAALKHAYGEFLSMRGPDVARTLKWSEALADLWLRRPEGRDASNAFIQTALRSDAQGVWRICAREGGEALKGKVARLLDRVDAAALARERRWAGTWAHPLLQTPWKGEALATLARVDRYLAEQRGLEACFSRVDVAEAEGAWDRGAELMREAMGTAPNEEFRAVADRALEFLERHRDPALLQTLTRAVLARRGALGAEEGELARGVALALEEEGQWTEAEALRRHYLRGDVPSDRTGLARMLASQGRFDEAAALFGALVALGPEQAPNLAFEWAAALRSAGRTGEARLRAREALERWSQDSLPAPRAGLAAALALAAEDPQAASVLADAMRKMRKEGGLAEGWPDLPLSFLIAALEAEDAARSGASSRTCGSGDPLEPPETRALALLARASVRNDPGQADCLDAALQVLGEAWEPKDPRLVPLLKRAAELHKDVAPSKAEAALRRALAILEAAREPVAAELLEARTLLALHLLAQGREGEGERVLQEAFDKGAAGFRATEREMEVAGILVLALLQGFEEDLRYDRALALAQRAAAVLAPLKGIPEDARRDLEKLLRRLERQARLQQLLGGAWPG